MGGGISEEHRVDPSPCVILDKAGSEFRLWYETHQYYSESREAPGGFPWEDNGMSHGGISRQFSTDKGIFMAGGDVESVALRLAEVIRGHCCCSVNYGDV